MQLDKDNKKSNKKEKHADEDEMQHLEKFVKQTEQQNSVLKKLLKDINPGKKKQ